MAETAELPDVSTAPTPDQGDVQTTVPAAPQDNSPSDSAAGDSGWDAFVQQHSPSAANENDATSATKDSGWNDFVNSAKIPETDLQKNIDAAKQESSEELAGIKSTVGFFGAGIIKGAESAAGLDFPNTDQKADAAIADFSSTWAGKMLGITVQSEPVKSDPEGDKINSDLESLHNSKSYQEGLASFQQLVHDAVIKPAVDSYFDMGKVLPPIGQAPWAKPFQEQISSFGDQMKSLMDEARPVDERGNPRALDPEEAVDVAVKSFMTLAVASQPELALTLPARGAVIQTVTDPLGNILFPNDPKSAKEFSLGVSQNAAFMPEMMPAGIALSQKTALLSRFEKSGILSGDEDAYFNEPSKMPIPETRPNEPDAAATEDNAPVTEPSEQGSSAPKTINDVVRQNEPELFKQYDDITDQQERLRTWISDLSDKRETTGDGAEVQGKIDTILGKVKGIESRLTNKAANTLEDLRDQLDEIRSTDTPDMAEVRAKLVDLDKQKRDMSEQVSAAYRTAQEQISKTEEIPVAPVAPEVSAPPVETTKENPVSAEENAPKELNLNEGEKAGSLDIGKQLEPKAQKIDIASDVSQKLVKAGRSEEEADANGKITAQIYKYFSDAFGGTRGAAEDWYQREGAVIAKQKENVKQLAQRDGLKQGAHGRYRPATTVAKGIIRLMRNADASTFIHESAHHYLDMLVRFSDEAGAPEKLKADAAIVRDWLGKDTGEFSGFTRRQHEAFARAFERYLHEGVAPTPEMAGVFAKFQQWMMAIYKTAKDIPDQKIKINDDIRNVFDKMLGGEGNRPTVIAPELPLKSALKDNIESPALKNLFGSVPKPPMSLTEWLADKGGLKDDTGDLKAMDADKAHINQKTGRAIPFAKKLVKDDGKNLEDASRAAQEAGYFPEKGGERPTSEEFLAKIREDLSGNKQYSDKDNEELNNYNDALKYNAEVDRISHETGIDSNGKSHDDFWDAVAEHYNAEKRYNEAHDMSSDAEAAFEHQEKIEREFVESRGESWEPPKEPDARTAEDIENERKQEQAANDAAKVAGNSSESASASGSGGRGETDIRQVGSDAEPDGRAGQGATEDASTQSATGSKPGNTATTDAIESARAAEHDNSGAAEQARTADASLGKGKSYFIDKKGVINFDLLKTPEDFQRYLQEYADKNPDKINDAVGGVQTLDKVVELSKATGLTTKDLLERKVGELYDGPKQVAAAQLFIQQTEKLKADADAAHASGDPQKILDFMNSLEDRHDYINMFLQQKGLSAEASRALGARRAIRKLQGFDQAMNVGELFQRMTGVKMKDAQKQADLFAGLTDPTQVAALAQKTREANWLDYMIAYRNNNILSGPVTHLHYADGNLVNLLYKPAKVAVASFLPEGPALGEAGAMYNSMVMGSQKAWLNAKAAWQDGVDISYQGISENYKRPTQTVYNQAFDKMLGANSPVGKSIRSLHTFFYTMNSEMIKAQYAFRQALSEGLTEQTDAFNNRVSDLITNQSPEMMAKIDAEAKEAMYLKNPEYNSFLGHFNAISNRTYIGRALLPFAKIEMNVKLMARDNTILGLFSKDVRDDIWGGKDGNGANGPEARAIRIAGMSMGTSLFGLGIGAGDKFINGNGPSDREQRKIWLLTHTPNSVQIGDISIPLRALGTPGQLLMAGAEIKEAIQDATEPEAKDMAAKFMEHVSNVVFKGTFVQNASETSNAFTNPGRYGAEYLQNTASGFVPYTSLLGQANRYIDPFQREVKSQGLANVFGITDYVKSRVPFASETLQPRIDVLGNPIPSDRWLAAGSYDKYLENPVVQGMNKLGMGLTMPNRDIMGIRLSEKQYNEFAVTSGTLIQQRLWNTDGYGVLQEPGFDQLSHASKVKEIHDAIKDVRKSAVQDMIMKYPEIGDQAAAKKEANEVQ